MSGILKIKNANGQWEPLLVVTGPKGEQGSDGSDGVTFIPSLSSSGVLTWTNDGGLSNPNAISLMGPKGDTGPEGPVGPMPDTSNFLTKSEYAEGFDGGEL